MIRVMQIEDYEKAYDLWIHTAGMGLNATDDSREGIEGIKIYMSWKG